MSAPALRGPLVRSVSVLSSGLVDCPGGMHAMTADSFDIVSLNPMLAMVAIARQARMLGVLEANGAFAVSVLSEGQRSLASWFASRQRGEGQHQFDSVCWRPGTVVRAPLIEDGLAWFECSLQELIPVGDHLLALGTVVLQDVAVSSTRPLLRFGDAYGELLR